jgi:hypothetical protein
MPNERPPSDAERARLAQIRQNTAIRNARNRIELEDEKDFWWKVVGVLVVLLLLCWSLLVWHQPGSSTPTTVGWVMEDFWIGIQVAIMAFLAMVGSQRGKGHGG